MKRYRDFNSYLKEKFGTKIYKIALDAKFSCPNQDGVIGKNGCIFCRDGSKAGYIREELSISEQVEKRIELIKRTSENAKFISYFQSFSNTYDSVKILKKVYDQALFHPDVVGLSIGTRPDCIDQEKIKLIESYTKKYDVWLEYGLQSIHKGTLKFINRGHTKEDFEKAVMLTKGRHIKICAHIILGLPYETKTQMLQTVQYVASLPIDGIKIHLLHVIKDTVLHQMYEKGEISFFSKEEYVSLVCDILEILPKEMIIHRLTGEADKKVHIAPLWALEKSKVLHDIDQELEKRDSYQGKR